MKKFLYTGILMVSIILNIIFGCCVFIYSNANQKPDFLPESEVEVPNDNLYYGSWEITDKVFIEKEPVRGLIYSEEELQEREKEILEKEVRTLEFTRFSVRYDHDSPKEILRYQYMLFPAQESYQLHFNMMLKDIGILQENADYFACIQLEDEEEQVLKFILKDRDTLILYRDTYFLEYKRVSGDYSDFILFPE